LQRSEAPQAAAFAQGGWHVDPKPVSLHGSSTTLHTSPLGQSFCTVHSWRGAIPQEARGLGPTQTCPGQSPSVWQMPP
jgi:hypothetical protein